MGVYGYTWVSMGFYGWYCVKVISMGPATATISKLYKYYSMTVNISKKYEEKRENIRCKLKLTESHTRGNQNSSRSLEHLTTSMNG